MSATPHASALRSRLEALLRAGFAHAKLPSSDALLPWIELAAAGGATPPGGPLAHDVVVGPGRVGLNVFQYGSRPSVELCLQWTREQVSELAASQVEALLADLSAAVEIQPGAFWSARGPRLKLYLGMGGPGALQEVGRRLGMEPDVTGSAVAMAVDALPTGLSHARAYRLAAPLHAEIRELGPLARRWLTVARSADGLAHPLLASRNRWPEAGAKRSLVQTFVPRATLEDLERLDRAQAAVGCPALDPALVAWLGERGAALGSGLVLRPVAHELDLYPDGRTTAEAFVTIGSLQ